MNSAAGPPSNITALLRCLSAIGPLIPVPGVAPAVGVVISILEVVESVQTAKKSCKSLAEKAAHIVFSLHTETSKLDSESETYRRIQENIEPFKRLLDEIKEFTIKLSRSNRVRWLWKRDAILDRILELTNSLDACYQTFQITSMVQLQTVLSQLQDDNSINSKKLYQKLSAVRRGTIQASEEKATQITAEIRAVGDNLGCALSNEAARTQGLLKEIAVHVQRDSAESKSENDWIIKQRELVPVRVHTLRTHDHAGIMLAKYKGQDVVVKKYNAVEKYLKEMATWRDIWHPYLPQLIGHSSESEKERFIVLRGGFVARDIRGYLYSALDNNTALGLLKGIETLYGISSAINYLRTEQILTKNELKDCAQLSNVVLSNEDRVVLGESLISCATQKRYIPQCHRNTTMEAFLSCEFFDLCLAMLSPAIRFRPLEVASGHGPYSIIRLLLTFPSVGPRGRTMSQVCRRIERAWLELNDIKRNKEKKNDQLTFPDIREVFLGIEDLPSTKPYCVNKKWDISTGNLGYVRHGEFVCLENVLGDATGLYPRDTELFEVHCDPPRPYIVESVSDDWERYEFDSPVYAYFWHSGGYEVDGRTTFRHLLKSAPQYLEKYQEHDLALTDLILVNKKETVPRCYADFSYRSTEDENDEPPKKVYLFLKKRRTPDEAWAYWSLDPEWVELAPGVHSNIVDSRIDCFNKIYQQFFHYVQLEKEDEVEEPQC